MRVDRRSVARGMSAARDLDEWREDRGDVVVRPCISWQTTGPLDTQIEPLACSGDEHELVGYRSAVTVVFVTGIMQVSGVHAQRGQEHFLDLVDVTVPSDGDVAPPEHLRLPNRMGHTYPQPSTGDACHHFHQYARSQSVCRGRKGHLRGRDHQYEWKSTCLSDDGGSTVRSSWHARSDLSDN